MKRNYLVMMVLAALGCDREKGATSTGSLSSQEPGSSRSQYVRGLNDGENLSGVNFQFTPKNGAQRLSAATWSPAVGTKVPLHKHQRMEEYFFIHSGRGTLLINDQRIPFQSGASLFVPQDTWHGFEFTDQGAVIYGVSSPPGLEEIFLAWSTPGLSKEQVAATERKHGLIWKTPDQ